MIDMIAQKISGNPSQFPKSVMGFSSDWAYNLCMFGWTRWIYWPNIWLS